MLENAYKSSLSRKIEKLLVGSVVIIVDTAFYQGYPDLLILWWERWGMLEVKKSLDAPYRPNQEHYLDQFNRMSFAAMICPENEEEVLHELQQALQPGRNSRVPEPQLSRVAQLRRR